MVYAKQNKGNAETAKISASLAFFLPLYFAWKKNNEAFTLGKLFSFILGIMVHAKQNKKKHAETAKTSAPFAFCLLFPLRESIERPAKFEFDKDQERNFREWFFWIIKKV